MEPRQVTSPSANHVHDNYGDHSRRRSDARSTGDRYVAASPMAVQIPNRRLPNAPPPLPPPRYVNDDDPGPDERCPSNYGSSGGRQGHSRGSFGAGQSFPKHWGPALEPRKFPEHLDFSRRQISGTSMGSLHSPTDSDRRYEAARQYDEGYYSLSGPNPFTQQLPGEHQLHHRDQEKSSQAYDKNLLSKLGNPNKTPPRNASIGSLDSSPTSVLTFSQRHPSQFRSLSIPNISNSGPDPPIKQEPLSARFADTPRSRPLSPGSISSITTSGKSFTDSRSPTIGHSTRASTLESDPLTRYPQRFPSSTNVLRQQKSRRSGSGSLLSQFDESVNVTPNRVKRETDDPPIFSETDSTFPMEETVRQLHLEDPPPLSGHPDSAPHRYTKAPHPLRTQLSQPGMKRKQPPGASPDSSQVRAALMQQQAASAEQYSNNASHLLLSASKGPNQYGQPHGSVSSQSSGAQRHGSYASSGGPSVGESSYTSIDQHSPGDVSPTSDPHQYPQLPSHDPQRNPFSMTSTPQSARAGPYPQQSPETARTTPSQKSHDSPKKQGASNQDRTFQCRCCPKKPKKFATQPELDQHQGEKNYTCSFCHNKFKNKNEAERHQNSIHKRTSSWSCAVLAHDPSTAFFPSTTVPSQNPTPTQPHLPQPPNGIPDSDICGYCGETFTNNPVDWEQRHQHLITTHKFGECNQSKKFYRADHFRQHLKHSHGGKNGKHTNMLEQACTREEAPHNASDGSQASTPTQAASAPVANMGNIGPPPGTAHAGFSLPDIGSAHHAQMQQMNPQIHMRPPPQPMDISKIDPSIHYGAPQGIQMQHHAGGYGYKPEDA